MNTNTAYPTLPAHHRPLLRRGCLAWAVALFVSLPALRAATPPGYPVYPSQPVSWLVVGNGTETWSAQENGFKTVSINTANSNDGTQDVTFIAEQSGSASVTYTGGASGGGTTSLYVEKRNAFGSRDKIYSKYFYNVSGSTGTDPVGITAAATYYLRGVGARGSIYNLLPYGNVSATLSYPAIVTVSKTAARSNSGSGSGQVSAGDGEKNLSGFFATPQTSQGGSLSGVIYSLSANNPNVQVYFSDTRTTTTSNPGATILARTIQPPSVTAQPTSQSVVAGAAFSLNVAASGDGSLAYQWHLNGNPIQGATAATYQVAAAAVANAGEYYAVVSNPVGTVASSIATVSVRAPLVITPLADKGVNKGEALAFTVTATGGTPPIIFTLEGGVPTGAELSPAGNFSFAPSELQGPATNMVTIRATDSGAPALTSTATFILVVKEVNSTPTLTVPTNMFTVDEGASLIFSVLATDADFPTNTLSFSLSHAPAGMTIDGTGTVRWPSAAAEPATNSVTVTVTDNGTPPLSASSNFTVTVRKADKQPVPAPAGLVAWYQAENNAQDSRGTNHGIWAGATVYAPGKVGQAFSFNGTSYVSVPDAPAISFSNAAPYTLEAWVMRTGGGSVFHVLGKRLASGTTKYAYQMGYDGSGGPFVVMNSWTHLAVIYDGSLVRRYSNAVLITQAPITDTNFGGQNTADMRIAKSGPYQNFTGLIDDVRLYNRALDVGELQAIVKADSAGMLPAPAPSNQPPAVTITSPTNGSSVTSPGIVTVTATASDADGSITKVEFESDGNRAGEITTPPYALTFTNLSAGAHALSVRAVDNLGASATATVTVMVNAATNTDSNAVNFTAGSAAGSRGSEVVLPVTVAGFSNVAAMQFSLRWDPAVIAFTGIEQAALAGLGTGSLGTNQTAAGTLSLSWEEPTATGASLPTGATLFALRFACVGSSGSRSQVTFSGTPTAVEVISGQLQSLPTVLNPGEVSVLSSYPVSGSVTYGSNGMVVSGVTVTIGGGTNLAKTTDASGKFSATLMAGGAYTITAGRADDSPPSQGVSSADLLLIRRHILGLQTLTGDALFAADTDGSGTISTVDILHARRLILGLTNTLPTGLWSVLTPARQTGHVFTNLSGAASADFIAIKMGDVNASWSQAFAAQARQATSAIRPTSLPTVAAVVSSEQAAVTGFPAKLRVRIRGFTNVTSIQFSLGWDPSLMSFVGVGDFGLNGLAAGNFGLTQTSGGRVAVSWEDPNGLGLSLPDDAEVFSLELRPLTVAGAIVAITNSPTMPEVTVSGAPAQLVGISGRVDPIASFAISPPAMIVTNAGALVQFTAPTPGADATFQWLKNGQILHGETNRILVRTNVTRVHGGQYSVIVGLAGTFTNLGAVGLRVLAPMRVTEMSLGPSGGAIRVMFGDDAGPGLTAGDLDGFEVWAASQLGAAGTWVRLTNGVSIVNGQLLVEECARPNEHRFYRVIQR